MELVLKLIGAFLILVAWWLLFSPKSLVFNPVSLLDPETLRRYPVEPLIKRIVDTRHLNEKERIELIKNIGDTWAIKLHPYGMYWHCKLKKFVVYTDPEDFYKYCVFSEGDAFDYFYGCDILEMNNNTVNCEKVREAGII